MKNAMTIDRQLIPCRWGLGHWSEVWKNADKLSVRHGDTWSIKGT